MLRKIAQIVLLVVFSPLILLFVALLVLFCAALILAIYMVFPVALRWHAWRTGTWYYVVCSPRHGWCEFAKNNLQPALPACASMVWTKRKGGKGQSFLMYYMYYFGRYRKGIVKPCLIEVRPLRPIRVRSLHSQLLPWKTFARKNSEVQQTLRTLIEAELPPRRAIV